MRACFLSLLCLPLLLVIRSGVFGPESRFTLGTRLIMMSDVCIHMHDCVFDGVELHSLMQRSPALTTWQVQCHSGTACDLGVFELSWALSRCCLFHTNRKNTMVH